MRKIVLRMAYLAILSVSSIMSNVCHAEFGLTTTDEFYTVDTGAGLVFSIRRTDNGSNTQSAGDIASLLINGVEFQDQTRGSQVNSGFDWLYSTTSDVSVSAEVIDTNFIKITVQAGELTHYYMARKGRPDIYMGDYFTTEPDVHNLVRYILRIQRDKLPYGPIPSDISETVSTVESSDIFALANGETRSKHYSNHRLKDWQYIGAMAEGVGLWVVRDNNEGNSGGPFYRSLLNQGTDTNQEITYIVNYGEAQTESPYRVGVLDAYTLVVTDGSTPKLPINTTWFAKMDLNGYVPPSGRGRVIGEGIDGRDPAFEYTVGFSNETAQYWADVNPQTGTFISPDMRPGTYTMKTYKNELAVDTRSVTVTANQPELLEPYEITGDPSQAVAIWRIGDWDGSPQEFLNGDMLTTMHPSDVRITTWDPGDFTVGETATDQFPSYMWKEINNDHVIYFKLTDEERALPHKIRIGLTCAFAGGRPRISVNDWTASNPSPSTQPSSRTLTVGTYRGNNVTYEFDVPATAWATNSDDWNALVITAISGSGSTNYLSAGYSIDAVDMLQ